MNIQLHIQIYQIMEINQNRKLQNLHKPLIINVLHKQRKLTKHNKKQLTMTVNQRVAGSSPASGA